MIKSQQNLLKQGVGQFSVRFINLLFLLGEGKESIIVPIYKKGDKTDCNNYRGISLLPTTYKILSNILLSRLIPYAEEVIGDHQCGFRRNRSATDNIFCVRQILEKNGNIMKQCVSLLYSTRKLMIHLEGSLM